MGFAIFAMVAFGQYRSMEEAKVLAEKFIQSKKGKTRAIAERSLSVIEIPSDGLLKGVYLIQGKKVIVK